MQIKLCPYCNLVSQHVESICATINYEHSGVHSRLPTYSSTHFGWCRSVITMVTSSPPPRPPWSSMMWGRWKSTAPYSRRYHFFAYQFHATLFLSGLHICLPVTLKFYNSITYAHIWLTFMTQNCESVSTSCFVCGLHCHHILRRLVNKWAP